MDRLVFDLQLFDTFYNSKSNASMIGTAGNDSLRNVASNVTIKAGDGDDTVHSEILGYSASGESVKIYAGAGNDSIRSDSTNSTIDGGPGDDSILTWGKVTVIGGTGNDTIVLADDNGFDEHKNLVVYNKGDGNDVIYCFNSDGYNSKGNRLQDTLQIVDADYSTITSGNDLIVKVERNYITLVNAAKVPVNIIGNLVPYPTLTEGDDFYENVIPNTVLSALDGNDTIYNVTSNVSIDGGKGDDYIENTDNFGNPPYAGSNSTLIGGEGNDTLINGTAESDGGDNVSMDGGKGNDFIGNYHYHSDDAGNSSNTTITSGAGEDTIGFNYGVKNLTITDFDVSDTLQLEYKPTFAKFSNGVLNVGGTKIKLANVTDISKYRNMTVTYPFWADFGKGYFSTTLGELLDTKAPYWKISGTTATYYSGEDKVLATVTGLKSGLKVANGEIAGIDVNPNNVITLSKSVLGTGTVELNSFDYQLALAYDVTKANIENLGWSYSGVSTRTATCKIKALSTGYYVGAHGKKIKYITKDTVRDVATVSGLAKDVNIDNLSNIWGGASIYEGEFSGGYVGSNTASVFGSDNIVIDGEDFHFNLWDYNGGSYENKTVVGGVGNDDIWFEKDSAVITTDKGNDFVRISGKNNKIFTGEGNDFVETNDWNGENTGNTVDTGVGDDVISGTAVTKAMITSGAGNDTVRMDTASYSTISTGDGDDFVAGTDAAVYDSWVGGSGTVITNSVINTGDGKDTIVVEGQPVYGYDEEMGARYLDYNIPCENNTIDSGAGDDYIIARGGITKSVISTGEGNDSLMAASGDDNSSDTIVTGAGNDSIFARTLDNSSISSGANDDLINLGRNLDSSDDGIEINVIDSEGNVRKSSLDALMDSISYSSRNTINAGTGNDTIALGNRGGENVIQYTLGDGNDTVFGFKTTDTLQITSGSYSSVMSGDNLVVNVGGGSITLVDYGNKPLSVDHIYPDEPLVYNGHTYRIFTLATTWEEAKAYCESLGGYLAVISDSDENKALYDYKIRQGYSTAYFGLSDAANEGTWTWANGDTSTYRNWYHGYPDNEPNNGQGKFEEDYAELWNGTNLTSNHAYTWNDATFPAYSPFICEWDSEAPSETGDLDHIVWTFSTVKGVYTATGKIGTKVVAKITNLKKGTTADSLSDNGKNLIKIASDALGTAKVTLTNTKGYSYKLAIDDEITSVTTPEGWSIDGTNANYKTLNRTAGYTVAANGLSISYNTAIDAKILTTVSGLSESAKASDFVLKKAKVTVSANALGTNTVTITGGYDLALGSDVKKSTTGKASWKVTDTTAEYTSAGVTEGYVLASDKKSIIYRPASGNEIVATLEGVKKDAPITAFSVNAKNVITIKKAALTDTDVTLDGDESYTLALGSDVTKSKTTAANWKISGTTAKYLSEAVSKGYAVYDEGKTISYIAEPEGGETVVTLTGLKKNASAKSLTFDEDNKVVIVAKAALTTTAVRIDSEGDEYNLALADDVNAAETTAADWSISGTTAKYLSAKTSEGYALSEDKQMISYNAASGGKTLVTVDGLKSGITSDKLSLENKTVKFAAEIFTNGANVSGKNYAFELTSAGKIINKGAAASLIGSSGNDILLGYTGADTLIGGAGKDSLNGSSGNDKLYGNGDDTLIGGKGNDILYSTAGENTLTGGAGSDKFYFTAGNATITDYVAGVDKIYLDNNSITSWTVGTKDVTLTTSTGTLTVKNGKGKKITINDTVKKYTTSGSVSANIAELWFADEDNFATKDNISDITKSEVVGELENNSEEKLSQENLLTFAK